MALCARWHVFSKPFHPKVWQNLNILRAASIIKWNKDWKPGPYPRTEEERRAAAKKYNLLPEDYKPFPEEEGHGDYPDLPPVSAASRNPYELFDYPHLRKNYGEPLHIDFDLYGPERLDTEERVPMPLWAMILFQVGLAVGFGIIIKLSEDVYPPEPILAPKQYPGQGVTHYLFEPLEE